MNLDHHTLRLAVSLLSGSLSPSAFLLLSFMAGVSALDRGSDFRREHPHCTTVQPSREALSTSFQGNRSRWNCEIVEISLLSLH